MARPAVSGVSSDPAQGQVLCNAIITTGQGSTIFCAKSQYHEGKHEPATGTSVAVNLPIA